MVGDVGGTISDLLMMTTTASWKVRLQSQPLLRIHSPRAKVTGKVCAFKHCSPLLLSVQAYVWLNAQAIACVV